MKTCVPLRFAFLAAILAFPSAAFAQETWDPGSGTWDLATTPNWNGGTATWANGNDALFNSGNGTVTVDNSAGSITFDQLNFNDASGGSYVISGGALSSENNNTPVFVQSGNTTAITIASALNINETDHSQGDQSNFSNASTSTLTLGAINVQDANGHGPANQFLSFNQAAGGKIVLSGPITTSGPHTELFVGINSPASTAGTYEITGSVGNGIRIDMYQAGTLLLGTSNLGDQPIVNLGFDYTNPIRILTEGAQTITNGIATQNDMLLEVGGSTADVSNYNDNINVFAELVLTAANGGRVNFNTNVQGQIGNGLTTTGGGTVALNSANGNSYGTAFRLNGFNQGTVAATLGAHMTLINNTSGTAFGGGSARTVNLLANSGLGGSGITTENVVATDATSVIAPGAEASSPTTLHLNGGLTEQNGLTMNFRLSGDSADSIDFGGSTMILSGQLTINLSGTPTVNDANAGRFFLLTDFGVNSSGDPAKFVVNAPAGYSVQDSGVLARRDGNTDYYVDLTASSVPEPSTYALIGTGLLALVALGRRRRLATV